MTGLGLTGVSSSTSSSSPSRGLAEKSPTKATGTIGGQHRRTTPSKPQPDGPAQASARTPTAQNTAKARAANPSTRKDPAVAALLPLIPGSISPAASATEYRPVFGETIEVFASVLDPDDEVQPDGARIYTRADAGVTPPRAIYPKLPSDPPGFQQENRTVLELVIGTNGLVERARLRTTPHDIHEFMLVSAAKAWIFEPATVDGLAVRYRHRVFITFP